MSTPEQKTQDLLKLKPSSSQPSATVVEEARAELEKEHNDKLRGIAKDLLKQAYDLEVKITKEKKNSQNVIGGLEKTLNKINNRIQAMMSGQTPPPEEESKEIATT
jgi:hypothetical protein